MSRLAKKPISIPDGVTVEVNESEFKAKGPKGELRVRVPQYISVEAGEKIQVGVSKETRQSKADFGTTWSLINNSVKGVTEGFVKVLEIEGVGYRAQMDGENISLSLGYVNPVKYKIPKEIKVSIEKNTIKIEGINKETVGQVAAEIRSLKKPEPYKGKGIRYQGEVIRRKVGKKAATTGK